MGVEPFLMANSAIGIVAQRLARRICANCKVQTEVDDATLAFFGYTRENAPPFYKGEGCDQCEHSGKRGRIGIFEVLTMNEELKRAVATSATPNEIRDLARKNGMKTLKEYAMFLMAEGFTSVDEVLTNLVIED
jgi:type II secretory ATPase GspE/PulE/Tfp pilus assembly ATPase PilB-like protein